jgi:hypothetical protein
VTRGAFSLPTMMGIHREWTDLGDDEIPAVASSLAMFCKRLLDALPELLEGLPYPDPG